MTEAAGRVVVPAATAAEDVIAARGLKKTFGDGSVVAVESADFTVQAGEFISLVGPSGCGKSTLLRLVAGLIDRTSGGLAVHGQEVTGPLPQVAMMFQKPTLLAWRTAVENVLLPTEIAGPSTMPTGQGRGTCWRSPASATSPSRFPASSRAGCSSAWR